MKPRHLILFILITFCNTLFAQHSVGFIYSGKILGNNYQSVYLFSLEYSPNLINRFFKIGVSATGVYSTINKSFIEPNTPINVDDRSYMLGIFIRYYPSLKDLFVMPFGNFELGYYFGRLIIAGKFCEESGMLDLSQSYSFKIGGGVLFFPESRGHLILSADYLFHTPKTTYKKANCFPNYDYTEYTEYVNLNLLLWKIGLQFDF